MVGGFWWVLGGKGSGVVRTVHDRRRDSYGPHGGPYICLAAGSRRFMRTRTAACMAARTWHAPKTGRLSVPFEVC